MGPHQRRQRENQLEAEPTPLRHGRDVVATPEGRPVQSLTVQASLVVSEHDPGLLSSVEREEILVAIVVHIKVTEEMEHPRVRERENRRRSPGGSSFRCSLRSLACYKL